MIVGITGVKNAGKDTAADYLVEQYGFERLAFADTLKDAACALFSINREHLEKCKNDIHTRVRLVRQYDDPGTPQAKEITNDMSMRVFLQRFGTEVGRGVFGDDFWINQLKRKLDPYKNYVIPDVRFNNEVSVCNIIIEVIRANTSLDAHASEQGLRDELIDYIITNNDTIEELHKRVEACLTEALSNRSYENFTKSVH